MNSKLPLLAWSTILNYYSLDDLLNLRDNLLKDSDDNNERDNKFLLDLIRKIYINKLKSKNNNAVVHLVSIMSHEDDDSDDDSENSDYYMELVDKYPGIIDMMKRGDIIENVSQSGYRSQGVKFFNGINIIDQNEEIDDYGTVPGEFEIITQFPTGYWDHPDLIINKWYEPKDSLFYWHSSSAVSPINQTIAPIILDRIANNPESIICRDTNNPHAYSHKLNFVVFEYNGTKYMLNYDETQPVDHSSAINILLNEYIDEYPELVDVLSNRSIDRGNVLSIY
jgi:hypothetical protein